MIEFFVFAAACACVVNVYALSVVVGILEERLPKPNTKKEGDDDE